MDLRHFDPAKLGSFPREWLSPAKMALLIFFDFFKTLYLHQKHIFCKSGNVKLLGLVCFIILRRKIYYTTICFFKSFVFNFSLNSRISSACSLQTRFQRRQKIFLPFLNFRQISAATKGNELYCSSILIYICGFNPVLSDKVTNLSNRWQVKKHCLAMGQFPVQRRHGSTD